MQKKVLPYLFYAWLIVLVVSNVIPNLNKKITEVNSGLKFRIDYLFHFLIYFSGILLFWIWKFEVYYKSKRILIVFFFILWLFISSLNEYCQHFIPGRSYNPVDLLMNLSGVVTASVISFILFQLRLRKLSSKI